MSAKYPPWLSEQQGNFPLCLNWIFSAKIRLKTAMATYSMGKSRRTSIEDILPCGLWVVIGCR